MQAKRAGGGEGKGLEITPQECIVMANMYRSANSTTSRRAGRVILSARMDGDTLLRQQIEVAHGVDYDEAQGAYVFSSRLTMDQKRVVPGSEHLLFHIMRGSTDELLPIQQMASPATTTKKSFSLRLRDRVVVHLSFCVHPLRDFQPLRRSQSYCSR